MSTPVTYRIAQVVYFLCSVIAGAFLIVALLGMIYLITTDCDGAGMAAFTLSMAAAGLVGFGFEWSAKILRKKP